jgi:PAS domain S-box-containing protein
MPNLFRTDAADDTVTGNAALTRSLKNLLAAPVTVIKRDFSRPVDSNSEDEFAVLGRAFNEMVAKRKRTEEDLRQSEERYRQLIETASDIIYTTDAAGYFSYVNPIAAQLLKCTKEDLIGTHYLSLIRLDHREQAARLYKQQYAEEIPVTYHEFPVITRDGQEIWFGQKVQLMKEHGRIIGFHAVARDITERKQMEKKLQDSEQQFRSIIDSSLDILTILNIDGTVRYNSLSVKQLLGYEQNELVGVNPLKFIHPDDVNKVQQVISQLIQGAKSVSLSRYRFRHKDGSWHVFKAVGRSLLNDPLTDGILISSCDITTQQHLESQLTLARKLGAIGQLAAGIAHEINTPMQYIGDNARFVRDTFQEVGALLRHYEQLLVASKDGTATPELVANVQFAADTTDIAYLMEETPCAIDQLLEGVERVNKIVCAMKEFSHPGGDTPAEADLNRAISTTVEVARNEWKYVAEVELDLDPHLPFVSCLLGEFNQVLLNLVINAAHAISDATAKGSTGKGTITVSTRTSGNWAEVRVRDTGTGIPEAIRSQIFDPFFTTKEVGKGTGQGLAIAHAVIVEKHKGTIDIETEVGKGTTFIIRLPLTLAPAPGGDFS